MNSIRHQIIEGIYWRIAENSNPQGTILYLHGLGDSGISYEDLITHPRLRNWNHLVPDNPGYGKNVHDRVLTLEQVTDKIAQILPALTSDKVHLFGHSMGGITGLYFLEKYPRSVASFINVEGNISIHDCSFSAKVAAFNREEYLQSGHRKILDSLFQVAAADNTFQNYTTSVLFSDARVYHQHSCELVEISRTEKIAERLIKTGIPQIYISGHPRGTGSHSISILKKQGIRNFVIEPAGHWPFCDQPEEFTAIMSDFLTSMIQS